MVLETLAARALLLLNKYIICEVYYRMVFKISIYSQFTAASMSDKIYTFGGMIGNEIGKTKTLKTSY